MAYLGRPGATSPLTSADIPDNSITAAKIVDATIAAGDLAPNSVDSSELVDGSVDLSHMSANSVDSDQYVDGSIDSAHLHTNAVFASGTKMIFNQTAAPTGWTKVTGSGNDTALRVTTGTVGTGGSVAFETAFASVTPTISTPTATSGAVASHILTSGEIPSHSHQLSLFPPGGSDSTTYLGRPGHSGGADSCAGSTCGNTGGGGGHTHSFTQPTISTPTSSAIDLNVSFVDVIIATKD